MADKLAADLMQRWKMPAHVCMIVGSVRRRKPDVGDLELIAPLPPEPKKSDTLYETIAESMGVSRGGLFAPKVTPIGEVVQGLKPGFLSASLRVNARFNDAEQLVGVQVFRYTAVNRGWATLMRTGPDEFGKWFLWKWKQQFGIPEGRQASIDGNLVDAAGNVVPVDDEEACFRLIRKEFIPPEQRAEFAERVIMAAKARRAEAMR